jgi:Flp pilus assembly protein TadG
MRKHNQRGAALVETAFVLPLILMLTFGAWTLARAWQIHNTMDHAVREGARFGATIDPWVPGPDTTAGTSANAIRAVIDSELAAGSIPTGSVTTICIEKGASACTSQSGITAAPAGAENVAIRVRWNNYSMNFVFWTTTVNLTATAISRWEQ